MSTITMEIPHRAVMSGMDHRRQWRQDDTVFEQIVFPQRPIRRPDSQPPIRPSAVAPHRDTPPMTPELNKMLRAAGLASTDNSGAFVRRLAIGLLNANLIMMALPVGMAMLFYNALSSGGNGSGRLSANVRMLAITATAAGMVGLGLDVSLADLL